jgi:hypothetical protein
VAAPTEKDVDTMVNQKVFKQRVRSRMTKTGESYTTARLQLIRKADARTEPEPPATPAPAPDVDASLMPVSDEAIQRGTGRSWSEWVAELTAWGAADRTHTEIATHVRDDLGVDGWWSQSVTVGFERASGRRRLGQMARGYSVGANRTVSGDAERALAAFTDPAVRERWLPGVELPPRRTTAVRTARFDWPDPPSRLVVYVEDKPDGKALVSLSHEKLPDEASAARMKAYWRDRLLDLKALLAG